MKRFTTFLIEFLTVFATLGSGSAQVFEAGYPELNTVFSPLESPSLSQLSAPNEGTELSLGAVLTSAVPDEETITETPPTTTEEGVTTEETIGDEKEESSTTSELSIGRFDLTTLMIIALLLLGQGLYSKKLKTKAPASLA